MLVVLWERRRLCFRAAAAAEREWRAERTAEERRSLRERKMWRASWLARRRSSWWTLVARLASWAARDSAPQAGPVWLLRVRRQERHSPVWMWADCGGWGTRCDVDTVGVVASSAARTDGNAIPPFLSPHNTNLTTPRQVDPLDRRDSGVRLGTDGSAGPPLCYIL